MNISRTARLAAIAFGILMLAGFARAECYTWAPSDAGACADVNIVRLYTDDGSNAYLTVSGNASLLNCTASSGLITVSRASANFKTVYATLLAAHVSGRRIDVRMVPGSLSACTVAYVTMY